MSSFDIVTSAKKYYSDPLLRALVADSEKNQLVFVWLKVLGPRRLTAAANYNELHHNMIRII